MFCGVGMFGWLSGVFRLEFQIGAHGLVGSCAVAVGRSRVLRAAS